MKNPLHFLAFALALVITFSGHWIVGPVCAILYAGAYIKPQPVCGTATLIVPILTGYVFEAFKAPTIPFDWFSTDFGRTANGFAQPAKFNQQVISQLATVPGVNRMSPGGIINSPQSAKGLVTDLQVKIDRMAGVKVQLPSADIEQLLAMPAFMQSLKEAGSKLGRFVVQDAISFGNNGANFTNVITAANPDLDTLDSARVQLNSQFAMTPRFGLTTPTMAKAIAEDPRVSNALEFGQKIEANSYASFKNIKGFNEVREHVAFPAGNRALCTVTGDSTKYSGTGGLVVTAMNAAATDGDGLTVALDPTIDLYNGARVQISSTGSIPTGLAAATNYYVVNLALDATNGVLNGTGQNSTFQLSATLGGAAIAITGNGSGTITITQAENCEGFFFEKRAIHIATRPMIDPTEAAQKLGIPVTILVQRQTDPVTGLDFLVFIYQDTTAGSNGQGGTLDLFACFVVQYGIKAGRGIQSTTADPTTFSANTGMDRAGLRVITA